ncbi:uncharacterized protein BO87DRAFT_411446 [Aspergillus neoniger CBS 115656]|uniref:Heat shock trehalose synthase n=1 Tax=Aspergillus neoniger (strain CBS 115656) TaxID=1448310 RepID=A0A318Y1C8_ASPNB|nr:hypothetical protein BO87DRAFT_411446 [Aspergillus neoniger CBS 115656]PYH28161.1 hypothetical protein BO87DRAFT_411446 [Aspergillus neoniger CBS 115656]
MSTASSRYNADAWSGRPLNVIYAGISELIWDNTGGRVAIVIRNSTDLVDFFVCSWHAPRSDVSDHATDAIIAELKEYREKHAGKIVSAALHQSLASWCPLLCSRLWRELDIVPLVLEYKDRERQHTDKGELATYAGYQLDVDRGYYIYLACLEDYKKTVKPAMWSVAQHYAQNLRESEVKIAFFSMTCQGKPDVPTRHALARFSNRLRVQVKWFVPKPRPGMVPLIRKMQDILEGLGNLLSVITVNDELLILDFAYTNARRHWLCQNRLLRPRAEEAVNIVIVDSAPLLTLALLSKQQDPEWPVIFKSSLYTQGNPLQDYNSPLAHVDLLVLLLPKELAPRVVPEANVSYIQYSVDQLDGQNKPLTGWDIGFYGRELSSICRNLQVSTIHYPEGNNPTVGALHISLRLSLHIEQYILHLSQFRPGNGTLYLLYSYQRLYDTCVKERPGQPVLKLLICHRGPSRTPESSPFYNAVMSQINSSESLSTSVCIIPIGAADQMWNARITHARALGTPIITTRDAELLPFMHESDHIILVNKGDECAIARHLSRIFSNEKISQHKAAPALKRLLDKYTTVGNAVSWFYLASKMSRGDYFEPRGKAIYKLAREEAGYNAGD